MFYTSIVKLIETEVTMFLVHHCPLKNKTKTQHTLNPFKKQKQKPDQPKMTAGHSLCRLYQSCLHKDIKIKSTDPCTQGHSQSSHAHQYTMLEEESLRSGACKCQAQSGSEDADVWGKDKCDGGINVTPICSFTNWVRFKVNDNNGDD